VGTSGADATDRQPVVLADLTRAGSGVFWITVRGGQIVQVAEQWSS
jgi:hypothetical protein